MLMEMKGRLMGRLLTMSWRSEADEVRWWSKGRGGAGRTSDARATDGLQVMGVLDVCGEALAPRAGV